MSIGFEFKRAFSFLICLWSIPISRSSGDLLFPLSRQSLKRDKHILTSYQVMLFNILKPSQSNISNYSDLIYFPQSQFFTGGISLSTAINFQSLQKFERNAKALGNHHKLVMISITVSVLSESNMEQLNSFLTHELNPLRNPIVYRDLDTFIIFVNRISTLSNLSPSYCHRVSNLPFISKLRDCKILCNLNFPNSPKSTILSPQRFHNFNSQLLRVSTTWRIRAYVEFDSIQGDSIKIKRGLYGQVLNFLSNKLNFTYKLFMASGGATTGKRNDNGIWSGTIGDILYGQADLGFPVGVTASRYEAVDLPCIFTHEVITFVSGPPVKIYSWKSLFWPFSLELWAGMGLALIASIAGFYFLQSLIKCILKTNLSSSDFIQTSSYFITTFIEQEARLPKNLPMPIKIHFTFWLLFALVSSTAYKSKMVGFLTFPILEVVPRNFEELADSDYTMDYQFVGGVGYNLFRSSTVPVYSKIFKKMTVERNNNSTNCFDRVLLRDKHICVVMINVINDVTHRYYSNRFGQHPFTVSPSYSFTFSAGFASEIRAPFSSNIKTLVDSTLEMGIISHWYQKDLHQLQDKRIRWEQNNNITNKYQRFLDDSRHDEMNLNHFKGPIVLIGLGTIISSFVFIGELLAKHFIKR